MEPELTPNSLILSLLILLFLDKKLVRSRSLFRFITFNAESCLNPGIPRIELFTCYDDLCCALVLTELPTENAESVLAKRAEIIRQLSQSLIMIHSLDDLYEWSKRLGSQLSKYSDMNIGNSTSNLSARSVTGSFVRKMCLSIQFLGYAEYGALFSRFEMFAKSSAETKKPLNFMSSFGVYPSRMPPRAFPATCNAELEDLVETLTSIQVNSIEAGGVPAPVELKKLFTAFNWSNTEQAVLYKNLDAESNMCMVSNHYLQYLRFLNEGDYHASYDSLHRYFDYMVSKGLRLYYHLALIAKAALHSSFGEEQNALSTLEEAANVAREQDDETALNYVLAWHFHLSRISWHRTRQVGEINMSGNKGLLDFLVEKNCRKASLFSSTIFIYEYEHALNCGAKPESCFQSMAKSLYSCLCETDSILHKAADVASLHWLQVGYPYLAETYNDISNLFNESSKLALEEREADISKCRILHWKGRSDLLISALGPQVLFESMTKGTISLRQTWRAVFMIKKLLKKGEIRVAKELLNLIRFLPNQDSALQEEVERVSTMISMGAANARDAMIQITSHLQSTRISKRYHHLHDTVSCLLIKVRLLVKSRKLGSAFALLLQAIQLGTRLGLNAFVVEASVTLGALLQTVGTPSVATEVSHALIPLLHRCDNLELSSDVYLQLARSSIENLGPSTNDQDSDSSHGPRYLSLSKEGFRECLNLVNFKECLRIQRLGSDKQIDERH